MVTKAIKRIGFRFSRAAQTPNKSMRLYQEDVDAVKTIAGYIEENQKAQVVDNVLFAKLYIHVLGEFLTHYGCTVNEKEPQKELHRILDSPIELLIEKFKDKAHNQELNRINNVDDMINYEALTFKECMDNLNILVTEALNQFSPKKESI